MDNDELLAAGLCRHHAAGDCGHSGKGLVRGMCILHYERWRRGTLDDVVADEWQRMGSLGGTSYDYPCTECGRPQYEPGRCMSCIDQANNTRLPRPPRMGFVGHGVGRYECLTCHDLCPNPWIHECEAAG